MNSKKYNKKVLLTGASGFVGLSTYKLLKENSFHIIPIVRKKTGLPEEIVVDFTDKCFVQKVNELPKVDVVVHLGAKICWDGSSKRSLFETNILATAELVRWTERIGAHFIFSSSAIVCGSKAPLINSKSQPNPDTDYGYSKWLAEEIIKMSGVKNTILRIAGIFGKNGNRNLGINRVIEDAMIGTVPIMYGDGKIKRNYIYVQDLSRTIMYSIEKQILGTHLVAGSYVYSIEEMIGCVCKAFLKSIKPRRKLGTSGHDQIIENSSAFPVGMEFSKAMEEIAYAKETSSHKNY